MSAPEAQTKAVPLRIYLTPEARAELERIGADHSFRTNLSAAVERLIFEEKKRREARARVHPLACTCSQCTYVGVESHVHGCRCHLCHATKGSIE